jgi:hypothetical protein
VIVALKPVMFTVRWSKEKKIETNIFFNKFINKIVFLQHTSLSKC